jgi:ClpP class serine protease
VLPRTGAVGSIGVVALHTDMSGALDQKGIAVTLIHAGSHKIDANPYQPLPEAVHDQMQRELEVVRFLFAETVAAGRGERLTQTWLRDAASAHTPEPVLPCISR